MDSKLKILLWIAYHLETSELVQELVSLMQPSLQGHDVVICRDDECSLREIEDADVMFGYRILPSMLERAKNLKWIQFGSAGIDHTLFPELLESGITLTTFSGVHPDAISEHVLSQMLALSRKLHTAIHQQMEHKWDRSTIAGTAGELSGKTVGIVGLGKIGLEIARLAKCFNMSVVGTKATPSEALPNVDKVFSPEGLDHVLAASDYLVLVVPLTDSTQALLGPREFGLMKPGAYLINVARGQMIDNDSLISALTSGYLSGAALDVFTSEPLPYDSPLWDAPNVIITPHTAGSTPMYAKRGAEIFNHNLKAFVAGGEMLNVFNREKGY